MMPSPTGRRLLFGTITFHPEPGAMRGLPLAKALRDRHGWDVEVLTAIPWYPLGRLYDGYPNRWYQREVVDGIPVHRVWIYASHDRSPLRRILTYVSFMLSALCFGVWRLRRTRVIYHVDNLPTTALVVALLRWAWGARVVQHIGDLWPDSVLSSGMVRGRSALGLLGRLLHRIMRGVYVTNDAITVITEGFRRTLIERGVPAAKVSVLPNWADEERLAPVPVNRDFRRSLGVRDDEFMVLYAGNIGPLQALEVVADAAARLAGTAARFVIVGGGPSLDVLRAAIDARGVAERVTLLQSRPVEQMPQLNAVCDALLVHLKDEPFLHQTVPSKTQVSLLAGRPVLMGCRGDAARHVAEAGAGLCFEPEQGQQLADAVRRLMAMGPEARDSMGRRGQDHYYRTFSLENGATEMHRIFTHLADGDLRAQDDREDFNVLAPQRR
jgi:glycosyltransferase involved in cell wall biosynthesis